MIKKAYLSFIGENSYSGNNIVAYAAAKGIADSANIIHLLQAGEDLNMRKGQLGERVDSGTEKQQQGKTQNKVAGGTCVRAMAKGCRNSAC